MKLQLNEQRSFVGPTYPNGVAFSTRKEGFSLNGEYNFLSFLFTLLIVVASSMPTTPTSTRFLSKSPARSRVENVSSVALVNNVYPAFLTFDATGQYYFLVLCFYILTA